VHEGLHDTDLLPVSLGEAADLLAQVEVEAVRQRFDGLHPYP
jgi:hypothetical protein